MPEASFYKEFGRAGRTLTSSDRSFGPVFAAVFLIAALWPLRRGAPPRRWGLDIPQANHAQALLRPEPST